MDSLGVRYDRILKWVAGPVNITLALKNVLCKDPAPGLDGVTGTELRAYLKTHGEEFRRSIGDGSWRPGPLRRGRHLLLVPGLADRLVFQALLQVLEPLFEESSSRFSYRGEQGQALRQVREREYREEGCGYILSPCLDKFVDTVDHQVLLKFIKKRIKDQKLLDMLGRILGNSLPEEGVVALDRGIRQCGCLSALFCNIYLGEFARKLDAQERRFTRSADNYRICLKSAREARELFENSAGYFGGKLKLQVNREKSLLEGPEGEIPLKNVPTVVIYRKTSAALRQSAPGSSL
jgi:retron-type reverse transcriptase